MTAAWLACVASALGCAPSAVGPPPTDPGDVPHSALAADDSDKPAYGKPELQKALIADRAAEATLERRVAELEAREPDAGARDTAATADQLRIAAADLAVRRRFIATLEVCESSGRWCPPRLDDPPWSFDPDADQPTDPPLTATLRFDLDSWRTVTAELYGRACACRTLACIDSLGVAIDQLEARPMREVQSDDLAATAITRARECLYRLRGRAPIRAAPAPAHPDE